MAARGTEVPETANQAKGNSFVPETLYLFLIEFDHFTFDVEGKFGNLIGLANAGFCSEENIFIFPK